MSIINGFHNVTLLYNHQLIVNMSPAEQECEGPFAEAFSQYIKILQEATCERLLDKTDRKVGLEELRNAGKTLVETTTTPIWKEAAKKLANKVETLESSDLLVSAKYPDLREVAGTLTDLSKELEECGFVFYATPFFAGKRCLRLWFGKGVKVESGPFRTTIFLKQIVEDTQNRIIKERNTGEVPVKGLADDGQYCNFEEECKYASELLKKFKGAETEETDASESCLRELAYGTLFERFKEEPHMFEIEGALLEVESTNIHEFYHEKISWCEEGAYIYSIIKAMTPESAFANLHHVYYLKNNPGGHANVAENVIGCLKKAGYSEERLVHIRPGDSEKMRSASIELVGQAKTALQTMEHEGNLASHEQVEKELKPDFEKYGALVRDAVIKQYKEVCK